MKLDEAGTTIVQVARSETNAAYGHRIVRLKDGRTVERQGRGGMSASHQAAPASGRA